MPTSISGNEQYPSSITYQRRVAAWVRFQPQDFSTRPDTRVESKVVGNSGSYILPLQRYNSPNTANYQDVEPGNLDMALQGARDLFTGGGIGKLSSLVGDLPILKGFSPNDIINSLGGIKGAALQDVSFSDLAFKNMAKRAHSFGFSLYAKNAKDADIIDAIANGFQSRMYPTLESRTFNKITPPAMWKITIVPGAGPNKSMVLSNQIQTSLLINYTVNRLDPSSPILTTQNYYMGLDLQLAFLEIEPAYRDSGNSEKLMSRSAAGYGDIL